MKKKNVEPICKNCEYFYDRGKGYTTNNKSYGRCSCPKFRYEIPMIFVKESGQHSLEKDNLVYADYEGYDAGFDVGIEFGCKHFKPKKGGEQNERQ